ncbi:MAG TPA: class I SAM-dependent methyltransferase, partial [Candidatus Angelobacter sp.]|nr:class I SAM-dependent methyltransferase [Candidatus Angelobacter sp.]
ALDVGLLERCVQLANVTTALIGAERLRSGRFLDFAGGYGTLTRFMRDRGFDFHHHDPLCENVFAQGFEGSLDDRYDLVTAFEVLEHLPDPRASLAPVAATTDLLLVTTQLLPEPAPLPGEWDYYAEETGQHVLLYTPAALEALARDLGMQVTSSGRLVHLFHRRPVSRATRLLLRDERLSYVVGAVRSELARRRGLIAADRRAAVERLRSRRG